ncbi:MAG: hypothetical protein HKN91_02650 [Acidimicrobiia bacterium]|nr:hypothetical protein [Acidimicrobiia bacterium]
MLTSITPLGERGRNRSWASTVVAYFVGSIAGGAVTGFVAGGLGALLPDGWHPASLTAIVLAVLAIVAVNEAGWIRLTPIGRRQVNEDWLEEYRGWVVGLGFGFQLGLGLVTIITTLAVPAVFVLAVLTFSWQWGLIIGSIFGLARALPILSTFRVTDPGRLASLHRRHDSAAKWAKVAVTASVIPLALLVVAI